MSAPVIHVKMACARNPFQTTTHVPVTQDGVNATVTVVSYLSLSCFFKSQEQENIAEKMAPKMQLFSLNLQTRNTSKSLASHFQICNNLTFFFPIRTLL